ncbi:hypothetical protein RchiOBHm_Chr3g0458681 [Rosa chinensis]|uniref:Uncharacterized protein n=1 Tax=Rosa chinensis TaxID=74649 RepID=A0A2P6R7Y2_ROSCH|nr:hypothetical protein RchiOBHm_Chr3g0458681 [Rosa chinensis]
MVLKQVAKADMSRSAVTSCDQVALLQHYSSISETISHHIYYSLFFVFAFEFICNLCYVKNRSSIELVFSPYLIYYTFFILVNFT